MNTFIKIFLLSFCVTLSVQSFAQEDEIYDDEVLDESIDLPEKKEQRKSRSPLNMNNVYLVSGANLEFWGPAFSFHVSPQIGYRLGYALLPAIGLTYTYRYNFRTETDLHIYGPKAVIRLRPLKDIDWYLHAEGELLRIRAKNLYYNPSIPNGQPRYLEVNQPRINVGFGYGSNLKKGAGLISEFLFDVYWLQTRQNYINPFTYRVGFYYGF